MTHTNNPKAESALRSDQARLMGESGFSFSGYERDPLFLNLQGKKVLDISGISGADAISDGRAGVFADFDNDGDLDMFVNNIQGDGHMLWRNNIGSTNGWLRVSLEGNAKIGPAAFGAQVRVKTPAGIQCRVKSCGEGFLAQHDDRLLFGLPRDGSAEWIEVCWPGGTVEKFTGPFSARSELVLAPGTAPRTVTFARSRLADPPSSADLALRRTTLRQGQRIPDLQLRDSASATVGLHSLSKPGRRVLVNFWATWCTSCAAEMPQLQAMGPALAAKGIDLAGISLDTMLTVDLAAWAKDRQLTYPLFQGGAAAAAQLYAGPQVSVPITLLLDANGAILDAWSGWSPATETALLKLTR